MKIKSSGEDFSLSEGCRSQEYELPDKSWLTLDTESDTQVTEWSYFWLDFGQGTIRPAWYRVFEKGKKPPKWQPMKAVVNVLGQTKVDHDSDDEDPAETRRGRAGKIGAAEKLPAGEYLYEVKIGRGRQAMELAAVEFTVKSAHPQKAPEFSLARPR